MKLLLVLLLLSIKSYSQVQSDTTFYIEVYHSITITPGTLADKSNLSIEFGKQFNVFSIGIDLGKTTLSKYKHDSLHTTDGNYIEIRPNLNIFQQEKFTNTLTIGIGYIFGASENQLFELASGIEYSMSNKIHLNIEYGQFFYSGKLSSSSVSFFGTSISYYFSEFKSKKSIIKL